MPLEYGKGLPEKSRESAGIVAVYGSSGVIGRHSEALVTHPCLVIGRKGSAGNVLLSLSPSWPIDTTYYAVPPKGLDLKYMFYALGFLNLGRLDKSTAVPSLSRDDAHATNIPIPPTNEQRRIVEKLEELLSDLDAGVATLRQALAKLKRYRQAVLKAAVEGELSREWREANKHRLEPASKLLERILAERRSKSSGDKKYREPEPPNTSELPELPEGWVWATIGQVLAEGMCNGLSVKASDTPTETRALRLNAMTEQGFDYGEYRYLPVRLDEVADLLVEENDFFVSRGNGSLHLVGRGTLAQPAPFKVIFPDTMIRLRFDEKLRGTRWIPSIWHSRFIRRQIERRVKTTAGIWKVSQPQLASIVFPLPPLQEQAYIVAEVDRRLSEADRLEATLQANLKRAERLRQAILKKAFSGELVPQDPNDEPASVLLERIRASRAQAPKKGKRKQ